MCDDQEAVVKAQAAQHRGFIWQFLGAPSWIIYISTCFSHRKYSGATETPCPSIASRRAFVRSQDKYGFSTNGAFICIPYMLTGTEV